MAHVLEQERHSGCHDGEVEKLDHHIRVEDAQRGRLLEEKAQNPGEKRGKGKLEDGEEVDVLSRRDLGHRHDVAGVENRAAEGQRIPPGNGEVPVEGDEAHPRHAEDGGHNIELIGPLLRHQPVEEGHDDAVHRRQKGVFGGGGPRQSEGLNGVGQEEERPHHGAPPDVVPCEVLPLFPAEQGQQGRAAGKPDGEQEKNGDTIHGPLHDEEGGPPDKGCDEEHGLCHAAHNGLTHGLFRLLKYVKIEHQYS